LPNYRIFARVFGSRRDHVILYVVPPTSKYSKNPSKTGLHPHVLLGGGGADLEAIYDLGLISYK
jgi:hypothetical protein